MQPLREFIVVGEQARVLRAQRDQDRACQRREIDHELGLVLVLDAPEHISEHKAALGVRVDDLNGLPGQRLHDVAGALRLAVRHVLDEADGADHVHLGLARGQRVHEADDAGGARHVALHVLHAAGRLDGNAARVERDALADERHRALVGLLGPVPAHDDAAALVDRPLPDAQKRIHAKLLHRLHVEDLHLDANLLKLAGPTGEFLGMQHVGRLVHKIASDVHAFRNRLARLRRLLRGGRIRHGDPHGKRTLRLRVVALLRLVAVKLVGPQAQAQHKLGSRLGRMLAGGGNIEHHRRVALAAQLAGDEAAQRHHLRSGGRRPRFLRRAANNDEPISIQARWRPHLKRGHRLALEGRGLRTAADRFRRIAQQLGGRRPKSQVRACEHHEGARSLAAPLLAATAAAGVLEGDEFDCELGRHMDLWTLSFRGGARLRLIMGAPARQRNG